jgi:hypothetical protein
MRRGQVEGRVGMEKHHREWLRPALAIGVLAALTGSLVASPVAAHFQPPDEKKHVKKIARKVARKEAKTIVQTTVGPTLFIEEEELVRWGPIGLNVGAPDQTIGTFGPFTLRAQCLDSDATGDVDINPRISVTTTENDSALRQYYGTSEIDFDVGEDGPWHNSSPAEGVNNPGDPHHMVTFGDGFAYVVAPSDASLWGETNVLTNFGGSHCYYKGFLLVNG